MSGWLTAVTADGRRYYYHADTRETRWDLPTGGGDVDASTTDDSEDEEDTELRRCLEGAAGQGLGPRRATLTSGLTGLSGLSEEEAFLRDAALEEEESFLRVLGDDSSLALGTPADPAAARVQFNDPVVTNALNVHMCGGSGVPCNTQVGFSAPAVTPLQVHMCGGGGGANMLAAADDSSLEGVDDDSDSDAAALAELEAYEAAEAKKWAAMQSAPAPSSHLLTGAASAALAPAVKPAPAGLLAPPAVEPVPSQPSQAGLLGPPSHPGQAPSLGPPVPSLAPPAQPPVKAVQQPSSVSLLPTPSGAAARVASASRLSENTTPPPADLPAKTPPRLPLAATSIVTAVPPVTAPAAAPAPPADLPTKTPPRLPLPPAGIKQPPCRVSLHASQGQAVRESQLPVDPALARLFAAAPGQLLAKLRPSDPEARRRYREATIRKRMASAGEGDTEGPKVSSAKSAPLHAAIARSPKVPLRKLGGRTGMRWQERYLGITCTELSLAEDMSGSRNRKIVPMRDVKRVDALPRAQHGHEFVFQVDAEGQKSKVLRAGSAEEMGRWIDAIRAARELCALLEKQGGLEFNADHLGDVWKDMPGEFMWKRRSEKQGRSALRNAIRRGAGGDEWHDRWVWTQGGELLYSRQRGAPPEKRIALSELTFAEEVEPETMKRLGARPYLFNCGMEVTTSERKIVFACGSSSARDKWIAFLQDSVFHTGDGPVRITKTRKACEWMSSRWSQQEWAVWERRGRDNWDDAQADLALWQDDLTTPFVSDWNEDWPETEGLPVDAPVMRVFDVPRGKGKKLGLMLSSQLQIMGLAEDGPCLRARELWSPGTYVLQTPEPVVAAAHAEPESGAETLPVGAEVTVVGVSPSGVMGECRVRGQLPNDAGWVTLEDPHAHSVPAKRKEEQPGIPVGGVLVSVDHCPATTVHGYERLLERFFLRARSDTVRLVIRAPPKHDEVYTSPHFNTLLSPPCRSNQRAPEPPPLAMDFTPEEQREASRRRREKQRQEEEERKAQERLAEERSGNSVRRGQAEAQALVHAVEGARAGLLRGAVFIKGKAKAKLQSSLQDFSSTKFKDNCPEGAGEEVVGHYKGMVMMRGLQGDLRLQDTHFVVTPRRLAFWSGGRATETFRGSIRLDAIVCIQKAFRMPPAPSDDPSAPPRFCPIDLTAEEQPGTAAVFLYTRQGGLYEFSGVRTVGVEKLAAKARGGVTQSRDQSPDGSSAAADGFAAYLDCLWREVTPVPCPSFTYASEDTPSPSAPPRPPPPPPDEGVTAARMKELERPVWQPPVPTRFRTPRQPPRMQVPGMIDLRPFDADDE
eukprot:Hpha_TRINITY_DN15619_c4_g6::TRINITY_DN15619_c4_g6_i1::g.99393::m.99393